MRALQREVDEPVLFLLERVGVKDGEEAQVELYGDFLGHMDRLAVNGSEKQRSVLLQSAGLRRELEVGGAVAKQTYCLSLVA